MSRYLRRNFFFLLILVFAILGPSVFFYSDGFRLDFKTWRVGQTGCLFVKAMPSRVNVQIGSISESTDLFFSSVFIENILPGTQQVKITKEGFQSWQKNLSIEPRKVTEAKDVILFKNNLAFNEAASGILQLYPPPDGNLALLVEQDGPTKTKQLKLLNLT